MTEKRKYTQKLRAEQQEETRRRIAEATAALHQEIGPAQTTISAIAERAGVERLTVYRHFPTGRELLNACQGHYLADHPPPNPAIWSDIADVTHRLRAALNAIYGYHRETEAMTANILRDAPLMPELAEGLTERTAFFDGLRHQLAEGWDAPDEARQTLLAALGHALDFETWRSLTRRQGLSDGQAVELMVRLVECVATQTEQ